MTDFAITGMTCNGCRTKVEKALLAVAPDAIVTLDPPLLKTAAKLSVAQLNTTLATVGSYRIGETAKAPLWFKTYYPLLLVMGLIALSSLSSGTFMGWMMSFMAGFYIVFGAFKMLDVPAFANSYAQYDIIAKRIKAWGFAYPFIEVALGFGFLFGLNMITLSWIALALSVIGAIGVIQANYSKQTIQCACLGTVFQLPMSVVTIVENVGMAVMAAWMIWGT